MTHSELCLETAKYFMRTKSNKLALYEYKSWVCGEEPDVLVYSNGDSVLLEIKMSRADFLADRKKECRKTVKQDYYVEVCRRETNPDIKKSFVRLIAMFPEVFYKQYPHLGTSRYFVCEAGLILPEEVPEHWGLYWYENGRFRMKKRSDRFRVNMKLERDLALHAFRRYVSGDHTGILISTY